MPMFTAANRLRLVLQAATLLVTRNRSYVDPGLFGQVIRQGQARAAAFLEARTALRVELADLVSGPDEVIDRIAAFLEIDPSPAERAAALAFVQPDLLSSRGSLL